MSCSTQRPPARVSALLAVLSLMTTLVAVVALPAAAHGQDYTARLTRAVADLRVAPERRAGYDRDLYPHWVDADGDGCDTRDEVLAAESRTEVGCDDVSDGRWVSWYDRETWRDSGRIDIDHMVPLAEAWDSGARRWRTRVRERFANDLRDRRTLVGVTDSVNQSKGDQDPTTWMPEFHRCRYLRHWVAVKHRWRLRVDRTEKRRLRSLVSDLDCRNRRIRVTRAR